MLDAFVRSLAAVDLTGAPEEVHRLRVDAFAPEVVQARSACNIDLLRYGLFTSA